MKSWTAVILWGMVVLVGALTVQGDDAQTRRFDLEIRARKLVAPSHTLEVKQGETVVLHWTTDETVEFHLHGYDIEQRVTPDKAVVVTFEAYAAGRFPITAHGFGTQAHKGGHTESVLAYLQVQPR
jgi:hypothetical protein